MTPGVRVLVGLFVGGQVGLVVQVGDPVAGLDHHLQTQGGEGETREGEELGAVKGERS